MTGIMIQNAVSNKPMQKMVNDSSNVVWNKKVMTLQGLLTSKAGLFKG